MRLDIVIPAHNEEHRIGHTLDTYRSVSADLDIRLLVALDRCTDRTADIVIRRGTVGKASSSSSSPSSGRVE